jgi:hypothetical protein
MKNRILTVIFSVSLFVLSGCSPVKIYSNPELTKKSGIKFYTVKPFLQIERDYETGEIVKTNVLYLPDLANPQYMAIKNGPGSRKVDLKLTDGCISTFGFTSDTKIDDYIDALSALLSKGTYAVTNLDALKTPQGTKAMPNMVEWYEIVMKRDTTFLREVILDIE